MHGKRIIFLKIKLELFPLPRSFFGRLEIYMVSMEFIVVPFKWNGINP